MGASGARGQSQILLGGKNKNNTKTLHYLFVSVRIYFGDSPSHNGETCASLCGVPSRKKRRHVRTCACVACGRYARKQATMCLPRSRCIVATQTTTWPIMKRNRFPQPMDGCELPCPTCTRIISTSTNFLESSVTLESSVIHSAPSRL